MSDEAVVTISSPQNPSMATESEGDIVADDNPPQPPLLAAPTWRSQTQPEEDTVEIEELPPPPPEDRPVKKAWVQSRNNRTNSNNNGEKGSNHHRAQALDATSNSHNTAADRARRDNQQQTLGSKPKLSNMSMLNSAVAHATLERCLLGINGGGEDTNKKEAVDPPDKDESSSPEFNNSENATAIIDYSKQCRAGHVIDILELRRLSSRGVPDEPPEAHRERAASAPAVIVSPSSTPVKISSQPSSSSNSIPTSTSTGGNYGFNNISYRPLVWRVLLGYLPPQTSRWNDVLSRDRKLYDTLVHELFSNTCPKPHDLLRDEEEIRRERLKRLNGEEEKVTEKFVIDDEDDDDEDCSIKDDDATGGTESTTKESGGDDPPPPAPPPPPSSPPTSPTTPLTPGLLSARMQQEWVRGEMGGKASLFHGENEEGGLSPGVVPQRSRISPMCAMNTPRFRVTKEAFRDALPPPPLVESNEGSTGSGIDDDDGKEEGGKEDGEDEELSGRMMESLLLPKEDDGDCDGKADDEDVKEALTDETMDTVNIEEKEGGGTSKEDGAEDGSLSKTPSSLSDSPSNAKLTRSVSISNTTGSDDDGEGESEGVELCTAQQGSHHDPYDTFASPSAISPQPPRKEISDEEENILLLDEIRKDVIRTHPDLRFFLEPNEDLGQKRYAALERILFVWAKLNKGVRYVQGMNEIVGTLYFVLAHDSDEEWAREAEADTYFLFNSLMVEMRDVFVPDLDEADTGIHGRISNMITLLSLHDPEVRCHLDSVGIDPSFYSVRWLTTLLSREFLLPDTIRLWDSMFASTHKDNFLRYVSVTMVMVIRDQLLSGDFSACLRLLQAYPPTNLDRLLESSRALWIYESQITLACHKGGISLGHALRSIAPPPAIIMAYGLPGGVAPPLGEQVRQVGERGLRAARGAARGAAKPVASAGRSFLGNAISFWSRSGSSTVGESQAKKDVINRKANSEH